MPLIGCSFPYIMLITQSPSLEMNNFAELKANYAFIDTPYDLLYACQPLYSSYMGLCILTRILGTFTAYIFPFIGSWSIISNCLICYIFTVKYSKRTRQTFLLTNLAIADMLLTFSSGWLWLFPAKGLPYASGGRIFALLINRGDIACRFLKGFQTTCSTWIYGAFVLICVDRMLAIYFPLMMIKFGYRSAIFSTLGMLTLCIIFTSVYSAFLRSIKIGSKIFCNPTSGYDQILINFLNTWSMLLFNGAFPTGIIVLINISLVFKMFLIRLKLQSLSERLAKVDQREIKATIVVFILSILFMIGFIPHMVLGFNTTHLENEPFRDQDRNAQLQILYNVGDLGDNFVFLIGSMNIFIYYSRIKRFRDECNKIIVRK